MKSYLFIGGPADNKVIGLDETTTVVDVPVAMGPMLTPPGKAAKFVEPTVTHYERREIGFGFYVFAPREWTPFETVRSLLSGYRGEFRSDLPGAVQW
jgi:hypothetical protein